VAIKTCRLPHSTSKNVETPVDLGVHIGSLSRWERVRVAPAVPQESYLHDREMDMVGQTFLSATFKAHRTHRSSAAIGRNGT
jgi:hypothetical protein